MIDKDMYLLAKKIVAAYEQKQDSKSVEKRDYTYDDMEKTFSAGINNGCYISSKIRPPEIDPYPNFKEHMRQYELPENNIV